MAKTATTATTAATTAPTAKTKRRKKKERKTRSHDDAHAKQAEAEEMGEAEKYARHDETETKMKDK